MSRPVILGPLARSTAHLAVAVRAMVMALLRRRALHKIEGMNDHLLRDIGLTRQDLRSVAAEPLFRDPTVGLASRAQDMRHAAWEAARHNAALTDLRRLWDGERHAA